MSASGTIVEGGLPTYQYRCTACSQPLEVVQSFTDAPLTECPACHGSLRKVFSAVGVVFKGSGFYQTDSRPAAKGESAGKGDSAGKDGEAAKPAATSADGGAKSDGAAKSTDKPAGKKGGDKPSKKPAGDSGSHKVA